MRKIAMLIVALALFGAVLPGCCKDTDTGFFCIIFIPFIDSPAHSVSAATNGMTVAPAHPVGPARCAFAR